MWYRFCPPMLLASLLITAHVPVSASTPAAVLPTGACRWVASPGGDQRVTFVTDATQTPAAAVSIGEPYQPRRPTGAGGFAIAGDGALDFDGDDRADLFRAMPRPDGLLQWGYLRAGERIWRDLAFASPSLDQLRFGDFNGDGRTDVFTTLPDGTTNRWVISSGGTASFQTIRRDTRTVDELRFGDFNGDGITDVFGVAPRSDGLLQWRYAPAGSGAWIDLNYANVPLEGLRFGDFDRDDRTDVFATLGTAGSYQWVMSPRGIGPFETLRTDSLGVADLRFGDFDGDGITDVMSAIPAASGGFSWRVALAGRAEWSAFGQGSQPLSDLRFGLFANEDGRLDVVTQHCARYAAPAAYTTAATGILGQSQTNAAAPNRGRTAAADTLAGPASVLVTPTGMIFVADYLNSRVLVWNTLQRRASGQPADLVIGQPDLATQPIAPPFAECAPTSATTLCGPESLAYDPAGAGTLYVADTHNHRVLAYSGPFTTSGPAATQVYGQAGSMSGNQPNRGKGDALDGDSLYFPRGLAFDPIDQRLFVADDFNRRVLVFRIAERNTLADLVLGYADPLATRRAECIQPTARTFCSPKGLAYDTINDTLYVADYDQRRVLQVSGPLVNNNQPAQFAFGQPLAENLTASFGSCQYNSDDLNVLLTAPIAPDRFCNPLDVAVGPDGALLVADATNSRILLFGNPNDDDREVARLPIVVFGQQGDFTNGRKNRTDTATPDAASLHRPMGMAITASGLLVSDFENHRVLVFERDDRRYLPLVIR